MLRKIILGIVLNGLALFLVTYFLTDIHYSGGLTFFVIGGMIIGILNVMVKPLLKAVSLPFVWLTAGLFLIVINTLILWLTKQIIDIIHIRDVVLEVRGIVNYLFAGFLFGFINWLEHLLIQNR